MAQVRILNLESLQGHRVSLILTDGGMVGGVLQSVSHLDKWDDILVNDRIVRSTSVAMIFVEDPRRLFWSAEVPAGGDSEIQVPESFSPRSDYYDPELYNRAVALIDQMVVVSIGDSGHKEYGVLEAVTPRTGDALPELELGPVEEGGPTLHIQIQNVAAIDKHVFTHDEADAVISQEGAPEEESSSTPDTVEVQREKAKGVHSPKDAEAAFGLVEGGENEKGAVPSTTTHSHSGEDHDHEGGDVLHEHQQESESEKEDPSLPISACNDHPDGCPEESHVQDQVSSVVPASTAEDDESSSADADHAAPIPTVGTPVDTDESTREKTSSSTAVNDAGGISGVGFEPGKSGQPLTSEDPGVAPLDTTESKPKRKKARRRRKK